jgi:pre-mRNA-splicing factor 38A
MDNVASSSELHLKFDKILRLRVYNTKYWKTECFGLTIATIIDKCSEIEYIGGTYGSNRTPSPFLCLLLKMLQINPEISIVKELLNDMTNKYLRALISMYIRIAFRPIDIYQILEPLLKDYRKLRLRSTAGWNIVHMDEFVESLLTSTFVCDISLPRMVGRNMLERNGKINQYINHLNDPKLNEQWKVLTEKHCKNNNSNSNKRKATDSALDQQNVQDRNGIKEEKGSIAFWNRIRKELGMKPLKPPFPDDHYKGRRKDDGKSKVEKYNTKTDVTNNYNNKKARRRY